MKDYSRKAYRLGWKKSGYPEMIRATPARAFWNSITTQNPVFSEYGTPGKKLTATERRYLKFLKQSEAKKPYLSDSYEEMEELWEGLPGLIDQNPHIDHPWMPDPTPTDVDEIIPAEPGVWVLYAFTEDPFCPGATSTVTVNGTHPIYDIQFTFPGVLYPGTSFSVVSGLGTPTVVIELTTDIEESGIISMRVYEQAFDAPPPPSTQGRGWTGFGISEGSHLECKTFEFQITRDDGQDMTPTYLSTISVFRSNLSVQGSAKTYYPATNTWLIELIAPFDPDDLYYVRYNTRAAEPSDPITFDTQYPYRYKFADQFNPTDRIQPGVYSDNTPYYLVTREWDLTPVKYNDIPIIEIPFIFLDCGDLPGPDQGCNQGPIWRPWLGPPYTPYTNLVMWASSDATELEWEAVIESSIPYNIRMSSPPAVNRSYIAGVWRCNIPPGIGCSGPGWCASTPGNAGTIQETVSDGLAANTYNTPPYGFAPYDDNVDINTPSVTGLSHTFKIELNVPQPPDTECPLNPGVFYATPRSNDNFSWDDNKISLDVTFI